MKLLTKRVLISDGSGIDSNKTGLVIPWTNHEASALSREYPFVGGRNTRGWSAILLVDGTVTAMLNSRIKAVR